MSVFDPQTFQNPPRAFRPLKIVHGLDNYMRPPEGATADQGSGDQGSAPNGEAPNISPQAWQALDAYLQALDDAGIGGIVANVGFQDYLVSPQQWDILRYGMQKAAGMGMRLWLYDEKGYPSGTAGGIVTRAFPEYVALGLACYTVTVEGPSEVVFPMPASCRGFVWAGATQDVEAATTATMLDLSDQVDEWGALRWQAPRGRWSVLYVVERVMYEGTHSAANVCEFKHYINLLQPQATRAFIRVTHEAYRRELPADIWDRVEAIFTDEPSFMTYYMPALPDRFQGKIPVIDRPIFQDRPPAMPWVAGFLETFRASKGYDLRPRLFALFYSEAEEARYTRQDYYEVLTRLYVDGFYAPIQEWCQAQGIASSGHPLLEESLVDHVTFHGDLLAAMRRMDLPGLDMLNSDPQDMMHGGSFMGESYMAAKQVTSAAHLAGRERIHSESSDWEQGNAGRSATLAERMGQANLQYVLGVNQITSYFGWDDAEAQRRYNEYVGRLGSLLVGGQHVCDVAVLYPIRTFWAHHLPPLTPFARWEDRTHRTAWAKQLSAAYPALVKQLLCSQVDLDIIDEQALIEGQVQDGALHVAGEAYRAIVLPPLDALSLEAAQALAAFAQAGGVLLGTGALPTMADAADKAETLRATLEPLFAAGGPAKVVESEQMVEALCAAIGPDLVLAQPNRDILYTHRLLDGRHVYLLINNGPQPVTIEPTLREAGPYNLYRPLTGEVSDIAAPLRLGLEGYEGVFVVTAG